MADAAKAFLFGRYRLIPDQRALFADGDEVSVGGRAFDLLLALVERRDRVVLKNELIELVWLPLDGIKEKIELLAITEIVLLDLHKQIAAGFSHDLPVPFYRVLHGKRVRELL